MPFARVHSAAAAVLWLGLAGFGCRCAHALRRRSAYQAAKAGTWTSPAQSAKPPGTTQTCKGKRLPALAEQLKEVMLRGEVLRLQVEAQAPMVKTKVLPYLKDAERVVIRLMKRVMEQQDNVELEEQLTEKTVVYRHVQSQSGDALGIAGRLDVLRYLEQQVALMTAKARKFLPHAQPQSTSGDFEEVLASMAHNLEQYMDWHSHRVRDLRVARNKLSGGGAKEMSEVEVLIHKMASRENRHYAAMAAHLEEIRSRQLNAGLDQLGRWMDSWWAESTYRKADALRELAKAEDALQDALREAGAAQGTVMKDFALSDVRALATHEERMACMEAKRTLLLSFERGLHDMSKVALPGVRTQTTLETRVEGIESDRTSLSRSQRGSSNESGREQLTASRGKRRQKQFLKNKVDLAINQLIDEEYTLSDSLSEHAWLGPVRESQLRRTGNSFTFGRCRTVSFTDGERTSRRSSVGGNPLFDISKEFECVQSFFNGSRRQRSHT